MSDLRNLSVGQLVPDNLNPRSDLDIDDLVSSIRTVGILQALLVIPIPDDTPADTGASHPQAEAEQRFRIVAGHRRHAAAVRLGLDTVPCLVAADQGQADTLVKIVSENGVRRGLRVCEEAELFAQLALLDWTPDAIAAAVVQPVERVRGALAVHRLTGPARDQAWQAADQGTLDLAEAAALAEFDSQTVERIISRGKGWGFSHAVAEERAKQTKRDATERLKAELVLAGARVTTRPKDFGYGSRETEAATLLDADGNRVDPEQAMTRPGFAVFVDAQATTPRAVVYCTDPDEWGYTRPTSYVPPAVAAQREREQAERQARLEALTVAAGVRQDFLAATWGTVKGAKTLHLHALRQAMTDPGSITPPAGEATDTLLHRLAGCDPAAATTAGAERLARILVARRLTTAETNLDDHTAGRRWRADDQAALANLDLLTSSGYVLSDAEQRLRDDLTAVTADPDDESDEGDTDEDDELDTDDNDDQPDLAPGDVPVTAPLNATATLEQVA